MIDFLSKIYDERAINDSFSKRTPLLKGLKYLQDRA